MTTNVTEDVYGTLGLWYERLWYVLGMFQRRPPVANYSEFNFGRQEITEQLFVSFGTSVGCWWDIVK